MPVLLRQQCLCVLLVFAPMSENVVPTQFAASLMRLAAERGYDFSDAIFRAGLQFDPLDKSSAQWRPRISAMQYSRLYQQTLRLLQDETFGLQPRQMVAPGAFRMMCYCIIGCENLGGAILRATEFYRTFFDGGGQLTANFTEQAARVGYQDTDWRVTQRVDVADAYGLSLWHHFFGWLTGRPIQLQRVDFVGDPPVKLSKYEELFDCPLYFGQASNLMYFDSACLRYPLVHTEQSLQEFLRTAPYQLLVMQQGSREQSLVAQVRAMIGHDFSQGFPSFETISAALKLSAPTLRRRLKREGTTFQQLKDTCRCEAARDYLAQEDLSIIQIALLT
jgi:AraC-like DNA-binding protein